MKASTDPSRGQAAVLTAGGGTGVAPLTASRETIAFAFASDSSFDMPVK